MNGILLVDKPADWTSHDVVAKLRGITRERKIGHSGTLDPMATGLLAVFLGRATRAVEYAEADEKEYIARLRPGFETDTQDCTGMVLHETPVLKSEIDFITLLPEFLGTQLQIPPMYSAIKVKGKKLYEIARKGGEVERTPRQITIHSLDYLGQLKNGDFEFKVVCSKGTYIRTLCNDMGYRLGTGGCMSYLRRTRAGAFSVEQAHTLEQIQVAADSGTLSELLLPVDSLFSAYPPLKLTENQTTRVKNGGSFTVTGEPGKYRGYAPNGEFLALLKIDDGVCAVEKSFFEVG